MSGRFGNAIDNFLIIMVAVAIVLLLVVMLGARQSPFRQKISRMLVQNPNGGAKRQPFSRSIMPIRNSAAVLSGLVLVMAIRMTSW